MKSELVAALVERQQRRALTDEQFARELDVTRTMWSLVRSGRKRPGSKLLGGVMRRYPDLAHLCLIYLRDGPLAASEGLQQ